MLTLYFPDEQAFYAGMNRDIYENFPNIRKSYSILEKFAGFNFKKVIYATQTELENMFTVKEKEIAVLITSIVNFRLWKRTKNVRVDYYTGTKVGLISAVVASGRLPLWYAILLIRWSNPQNIYSLAFNAGVKQATQENKKIYLESDIILDIGPSAKFSELGLANEKTIVSRIDNKFDSSYIFDFIRSKKFLNYLYAAKRFLGVAVATRNNAEDKQNYKHLDACYSELVNKVNMAEFAFYRSHKDYTKEGFEECKQLLQEILKLKKVSFDEVKQQLMEIQQETAIDIISGFL